MTPSNEMSFEKAYARLEEILEHLNAGEVPLEESLRLYEEAEQLITSCSKKLSAAEQKVQTLIKNRNGEIELDSDGKPLKEDFSTNQDKIFT